LTRQVAGVRAAQERGESTKFFGLAKATGRNRSTHANRFLVGRMTCGSCREFEILA
jgi:hypothetical protein